MQFQFIIPGNYTFKDMVAFNQATAKRRTFSKILVPIIRVLMLLAGIFFFVPGVVFVLRKDPNYFTGIVCIFWGLLLAAMAVFYFQYMALRSRRSNLKVKGKTTITIDENGIEQKRDELSSSFSYDAIVDAVFYKDIYLMYVDKSHAVPMPLRCLASGTPGEFEQFWNENCKKKIRNLEKPVKEKS